MAQRRRVSAVRCTVVLAALGVGCGGSGGGSYQAPSAPSVATPPPAGAITITIVRQDGAQSFSPNPADAGGEVVVFRNADTIVHRVRLNDGSIDTGDIAPGATSRPIQMPPAGTNYHCPIHPDMIGSVNTAGGEPPPPCDGSYC